MLILHVSDIHFKAPDCLSPDTDPDHGIRSVMMRELRRRIAEVGPVDAILIGGDIAYKGSPEEYGVAWNWLQQLATVTACHESRIFVVPGNHDVDRAFIRKTPATRNVQNAISGADSTRIAATLREQFLDEQTRSHLLAPLSGYNEFAAKMNCQVYGPERLYCKQDLELEGGVTLRIHGITSTLLSGRNGDNDSKDMYVSPLQTVLEYQPDVVNLVMVHHPIDWCRDGDELEDAYNNRAMIQLFGHKHRQRITPTPNWIRIGAGAVNPSQNEGPYEPGYNLIWVGIEGERSERQVTVDVVQYQRQTAPEGFYPLRSYNGKEVFKGRLAFPAEPVPTHLCNAKIEATQNCLIECEAEPDMEAAMGQEGTRELVYRFWRLAGSERRSIALALHLIGEEELRLPEPERYGRALIRASERGQLDEVAREVAKREGL
jgi:calcineurin-like phosphoesterase family protein